MSEKSQTPITRRSVFVSRRQFIQLGVATVGAAWGGVLLQKALFPETDITASIQPVTFSLDELPVGGTKNITYGGTEALVIRTPESIRAFSLICTHLGCLVQWQESEQEFFCPCHDGYYDQFGEVIGGPPPVPLEQLPVRLENDQVIVGEAV